ncbi:putative bifunctional diguanylate cyclase/phosphodiesterase [Kineococcus sp. SYSU DK001]|uniref:putative bifunctional diguanylate cyclase/phosphodiesterase n=1 Tax=Kineococcus sp. SYSU DK001 TaxID=3383122 RepID=UPI003D7C3A9E
MQDQRSGRRRFDGALAGLLALVALAFALPLDETVTAVLLGACAGAGLLGVVAGSAVHRPAPRTAWWAVSAAGLVFGVGLALRPWSMARSGPLHQAADVVSLCGYGALVFALAALLHAHGGLRREVVVDVLVLTAAGGLAALRLLVLPALAGDGADRTSAVLAGVHPLVDVVVLGLAADLVITAPRHPSNRLLLAAVAALLAGDVGYSRVSPTGLPPEGTAACYALAYLLLGAAALHPAQARFRVARTPAGEESAGQEAWNVPRLVLLGVSLGTVAVLAAWPPPTHRTAYGVCAGATLLLVFALLVFRAVSAVNGHARSRAVLQRRASHDELTDLATRSAVDRAAADLLARPVPAGTGRWVLFCDLDGFKRVNDRWGHEAGDELLRLTARRILAVTGGTGGTGGTVVGRLSGDEFVVVTTGTRDEVEELARALLSALGEPARLSTTEVVVTGSVGIASLRTGPTQALRDADAAMYRAKAQGRNRWATFDESMRTDVGHVLDLEAALRHAVATDGFHVHYQPVVDVQDGRPRGVEALLRWDRPGVGPVPPTGFVPALEDTGLIVAVGRSVLARSLAQLAAWRAAGVVDGAFTVSVNVSPRQLFDPGFAADVAHLLDAHALPGPAVVLELTESSMLEGDEATLGVLHELRGLGVELAVDDFGTGYSALSYLRDFPVTRVKIDRRFVDGIGRSARDEEVVRAVVAVSTALGLAVTAEGVETAPQRDVLRGMGVAHGQGWLWCRALPPSDLEPVLRQRFPEHDPAPGGAPHPVATGRDAAGRTPPG